MQTKKGKRIIMKKIKISILLLYIMSMSAPELFADYAGKTIDSIDLKNWSAKQKVMTSAKGTKITYVDRKKTAPKIDTGIMLPSAMGAYLNIESPVLNSDFSKGLGMTIKFKLFPRNKTKKILRTLISKYDYGTNNRCFSFMISNNNQLQFAVSKDGVKLVAVGSKIKLEDEKEYIATAIFHPAQTLELYLNGTLLASKNINIKKIYKGKCDLRAGSRADKSRPTQLLNGIIYNLDFFIPAIDSSKKRLTNTRPHKSKSPLPGVTGIAIPFSSQNKNWQSALKQDALTLPGYFFKAESKLVRGKIAKLQSTVKAVYLSDALVLSVHCPITNMKAAIAAPKNNSIEFCIDPNNGDQTLFAVKVQIDGKVSSAFIASCDYVQKTWQANAQTKVKLNPDSYDVMVKIPYESFGMKLSQGDIIGLAISVTRKTNGRSAMTTWPNRKVFWTWWQRRRLPDPFFFADILLDPRKKSKIKFISTTRGALLAKGADAENSFAGEFSNSNATKENVNIEAFVIKNGSKKNIINRYISIPPKSSLPIRFSYPGDVSELSIIAKTNNTSLYQTKLTRRLDIPQRIHDLGGSFIPQLIKKVRQPLAKQGFIIYPQHLKGREGANQSAIQFAYAYDLKTTVAAMKKNKEIPHMTVRTSTDYNNLTAKAGVLRKNGVKVMYYPTGKRLVMARPGGLNKEPYMVNVSKRAKTKSPWDFKALPSDGYKEDYFLAMKQDFNKYGDMFYALILPDEFDYSFIKAMKAAFATPESQKRNPLIMKINEDIKKRFGDGRYGLYNSSTSKADEPYCKIAMHRWLNDWIAEFIREVAKKARSLKPDIKIVSDDPQGMVFPYDYRRRWNGVVDIVIHQTHDKCMPQDIGTAVISKFVKDISGVEEFWPCVHVEGSSSIFSLNETREELSRAFRNGATGVTLFNLNWGGALGFREDIGAPERWDYIIQIAAFYSKGFRAKIPEKADVGVFFSNYSTMADYARGLGYVYMYLGPATKGYFKFFDDSSLERGDVSAADYKVVFVHYAKYESPGAVKKLLEAVRDKGITLVITDPHAFTKDGVGKAIAERDDLFGSTQIAELKGYATVVPTSNSVGVFSAMKTMKVGKAWSLKPDKNAVTLLSYSSGEPACVSRKLGKGRVIIFGFNPFFYLDTMTLGPNAPTGFDYGDAPIADPNLAQINVARKQFFTMLLKYLNVSLDAKIWNLKVPVWEKNTEWPAKSCLSGNSIFWSLNRPRTIANVPAHGKYRCSPVPHEQEKSDKKGWVKFIDGALFDRVDTFRTGKSGKESILTWNSSEPVTIKINLGYLAKINEVDLYLSGVYADCKIYSSKNGEKWQLAGSDRSSGKTDGVVKKRVKLKNTEAQYLDIKFKAGKTQGKLIISEIDIWGETPLLNNSYTKDNK